MRRPLRSGAETGSRRRDELLAAAEELIVERGLAALTVDDVTGRAGVAKGTFYIYFSAKGELLAALRERYAAAICDQQERALAELAPEDHAGRLERWVAEAIGAHLEHERLHDALFHHDLPAVAIKTGVTVANPQLDLLRGILAAGSAAGAFSLDDVETITALLYGAMHAAVDLLLDRGERPLDVDRVVGATQRFARGAVGAG
jgi:AcrR family transcriptional regulator